MRYIIVTGSRYAAPEFSQFIREAISDHVSDEPWVLVHGNARGVDQIAELECFRIINKPYSVSRFDAEWTTYGKAAGPIRNQQMADFVASSLGYGDTARCLAFHDNWKNARGTKDMIRRAQNANIPVHKFTLTEGQ